MRILLAKLAGNPWLLKRLGVLVLLAVVGVGAFYTGKRQGVRTDAKSSAIEDLVNGTQTASNSSNRVVAYLYNKPVARDEYGEYLIARSEPAKLDFMLNRKIVEIECQKHGVWASDAEVDERFERDLGSFGPTRLTKDEFVNSILKRFNKTLHEWREDVIRPKLMMEKLVRSSIKVSDKDIQDGFEARYGPQVEIRMIVLDRDNLRYKTKVWEAAHKSKEGFLEEAKKQPIPQLAAEAGKVPPIHRHFGDKKMEAAAFSLKEGEVSSLIELENGTYVILLCEKHVPASKVVALTAELRTKLYDEIFSMRVQQRIPEVFRDMRNLANPRPMLGENAILLTSHTLPSPPELKKTMAPPTQTIHIPAPPTPGAVVPAAGLKLDPIAPSEPLRAPKIAPPVPTPEAMPTPTPVATPTPTPMPMATPAPMPMVTQPLTPMPKKN